MSDSETFVKVYDYIDETGKILFQSVRYPPAALKYRRPDGNGGWIYDLYGVRLVPFNLSAILTARADLPIFITGSEMTCGRLKAWGLPVPATTLPAGWRHEYAPHFRGKRVVVLLSGDARWARGIARGLLEIAAGVKVLELPGKADVDVWISAGGTVNALGLLLEHLQEWCPEDNAANLEDHPAPGVVKKRTGAVDEAAAFLSALLSEGPQPAAVVREFAGVAGIAYSALRRADQRLGVRHRKMGGRLGGDSQWYWCLSHLEAVQDAHFVK
jgi:hypothetical protein